MKKIVCTIGLILVLLTKTCIATEETSQEENFDDLVDLISETDPTISYPDEMQEGNMDSLKRTKEPRTSLGMIEDDVYEIKKEVHLREMIDGNVYIMAEKLVIDGAMIHGNLYAMARQIKIENSEISGSVYAMGQEISLAGTIDGDAYIISENTVIEEKATIWRSVRILADQLDIRGTVGRSVYASLDTLNVLDTAKIEGELSYVSNQKGSISETAQIGNVEFIAVLPEEETTRATTMDYVMDIVSIALRTAIIGFIVLCFVNKFRKMTRENVVVDFLKFTGKGLGVFVCLPALAILLMISMIGTALGISLLALYFVLLYIATTMFSLEIVYRITTMKKQTKVSNVQVIGIAILLSILVHAMRYIPVAGGWIHLILILMGLGILWDMMFKKIKKETDNGEINEN